MGEKIKELRDQCQLTQEELAEKISCSRETINRYENNSVKNPNFFFICSLAELFNVSSDYFKPDKENLNE